MSTTARQTTRPTERSKELMDAIWDQKPVFKRVLGYTFITAFLSLAPTGYMMEVYDRVVNSRNGETLLMLTVLVLFAYLMLEFFELVRVNFLKVAGDGIERRLRLRLFDLGLDAQLKFQPVLSQGLFDHLRRLREFMSSPAMLAVFDAPMSLIFLVLVFMIHPYLGFFSLLSAVVQFVLSYLAERRTQVPYEAALKASNQSQTFAGSVFRSAHIVRALGMERAIHRKWLGKQNEFLELQAAASDHAGFNSAVSKFIQVFQGSMILGLSCWLTLKGLFSGHSSLMIVASILGGRILQPLVVLTSQWRSVAGVIESYERLNDALSQIAAPPSRMSLPAPKGVLTVEQISAGFPGSQSLVLRGLQFAVQPGEILLVAGPSASGKSTLCKLLVGALPPVAGKVRVDGSDVHTWNKEELGPHIGYLPQEVELLEGTLADNVARFGAPDAQSLAIALQQAGATQLVAQLPGEERFALDENGSTLSGGERQKIGLARAFYGAPCVLVLDEPNASLDDASEARLLQSLIEFKKNGAAIVVVSHQTKLLQVADKLLVLRDGQQLAFGPRDEVLAKLSPKPVTQQSGS